MRDCGTPECLQTLAPGHNDQPDGLRSAPYRRTKKQFIDRGNIGRRLEPEQRDERRGADFEQRPETRGGAEVTAFPAPGRQIAPRAPGLRAIGVTIAPEP